MSFFSLIGSILFPENRTGKALRTPFPNDEIPYSEWRAARPASVVLPPLSHRQSSIIVGSIRFSKHAASRLANQIGADSESDDDDDDDSFADPLKREFQLTLSNAKLGDPQAQVEVGLSYEQATGTEMDLEQAFMWYSKAAEAGLPEALYLVGECYYHGSGIEEDDYKAVHYYTLASEKGWGPAHYRLGQCYYLGYGTEKVDTDKAFGCWSRAADSGVTEAQYFVAQCFAKEAIEEERVEEERRRSQLFIPSSYSVESLVNSNLSIPSETADPPKPLRAVTLPPISIADPTLGQHNPASPPTPGSVKEESRPGSIIAPPRRSSSLYQGPIIPLRNQHPPPSPMSPVTPSFSTRQKAKEKAFAWYLKAANKDHAESQLELAKCYEKGFGTAINPEEAFNWYKRAAEYRQGPLEARFDMGRCYAEGIGCTPDDEQAFYWYRLAGQAGYEPAYPILVDWYEQGRGVKQSDAEAQRWRSRMGN